MASPDTNSIRHRPFIIPVFIPHSGCPHQCAFCNQTSITGYKYELDLYKTICPQIDRFLTYKKKHKNEVQVAFFGGNFLGLKKDIILSLLSEADKFVKEGKVDSIRLSTRPDTINDERLNLLEPFPVSTIELGVQSMDDQVLSMANRGHTTMDTEKAVTLLKKRRYKIGLQMMVGLPGDTEEKSIDTGKKIAALMPCFVRIYPTVVLKKSPLATMYKKSLYQPIPLDACVSLVKKLYLFFSKNDIPVIRMGLQASEELDQGSAILAGPYHPAFGHLVFSEIFLDKAVSALQRLQKKKSGDSIILKVHPKNISKMRGLKNSNIGILKEKYNLRSIKVIGDGSVTENEIFCDLA